MVDGGPWLNLHPALVKPLWRNGRRGRLKICCSQGRGGSSPSRGTKVFKYLCRNGAANPAPDDTACVIPVQSCLFSPRHDFRATLCWTSVEPELREQAFTRFALHMEALDKHRGKGQRTIRVEHVTVNAGGKAIVGSVQGGGGVSQKSEDQPHANSIAHAQEPEMQGLIRGRQGSRAATER
jgi:hypothetical protein